MAKGLQRQINDIKASLRKVRTEFRQKIRKECLRATAAEKDCVDRADDAIDGLNAVVADVTRTQDSLEAVAETVDSHEARIAKVEGWQERVDRRERE